MRERRRRAAQPACMLQRARAPERTCHIGHKEGKGGYWLNRRARRHGRPGLDSMCLCARGREVAWDDGGRCEQQLLLRGVKGLGERMRVK